MTPALRALLAAAAALARPAAAAPPGDGSAGVPASSGTVVLVRVERRDVFDPAVPGEDWWPFRAANRIHVVTREDVIRRELLFGEGDAWDSLKVIQSERNLRANGSFRRAEIVPVPREDGRLDALVRTQDSWTTNVRLAFGTEGGESFSSWGLAESNLLGRGKALGLQSDQTGRKRQETLFCSDPRFLGSRLRLDATATRSNDGGDSGGASLTRPFYALEATDAEAVAWSRTLGDSFVMRDGEEYSRFRERRRIADLALGARLPFGGPLVQRAEAGWYTESRKYESTSDTKPGTLPSDREISGPLLGYTWVQPRFIKETDIDAMERVEDYNLGNELVLRAGPMPRAFGSDSDLWLFRVENRQGLRLGPGRFAQASAAAGGRLEGGRIRNGILTAAANGYWKTGWPADQTLAAHLEAAFGRTLDPDSQIALGGSTGLRGYKNNSFVGGRAYLASLENRFFAPGEYLHLLRLGGAVFIDAGRAAPERSPLSFSGMKADAGVGLRAASSRSKSGGVLRVDLAYAMHGGPGGSRWVLSVRGGQAFSLSAASAQRVAQTPGSRLQ